MAKGKTLIGAIIGAIVGVGLLVLFFWLSSVTGKDAFAYASFGGWLVGGFVAGLIATTPGKGALAGLLTSVFAFIINTVIIVLLTIVVGETLIIVIFGIASLGTYDPSSLTSSALIIFILVGLLISFLLSLVSAIPNVIAGLLGGVINNPKTTNKDAYQEYPGTNN